MMTASVLFTPPDEVDRYLPESPHAVTLSGRPAVAWINIQTAPDAKNGAIHLRFWDNGEHRVWPLPGRPGFIAPTNQPNVMFVGRDKELGTLDLQTGAWTHYAVIPDTDPWTTINDGSVVPGGSAIVLGTKDTRFKDPIAALFLFTIADRRVTVLAGEQIISNGKVFARDANGLILYDIDTPRRTVSRYRLDLDSRSLKEDGMAVDLRAVDGFPDGMVDAGDSSVIIAMYNPGPGPDGRAYRYELSTGKRVGEWIVPGSPRVTCPLLLQRSGSVQLVLTTAVEGMPAEIRRNCPHAGDLFIAGTELAAAPVVEPLRL